MKEMVIVATHTYETRGGISSALAGFEPELTRQGVTWSRINSHSDQRGRLNTWFGALRDTRIHARRLTSAGVFWFHCGPWLSMLRKLTLARVAKHYGGKVIIHLHSPALADYLQHPIKRQLVSLLIGVADEVFVVTPWWAKQVKHYFPEANIQVCINPLSEDVASAASEELGKANDESVHTNFEILTMSRLIPGKGTEHVLQAIALLPENFRLTVAGDGPMLPQLKALAVTLGVAERVKFVGWVSGTDKFRLLAKADGFCLPSRYDSFGVVFIEAMAFGLPVIACNWGPISDVVTPEAGVLVNEGDSVGIANAISDWHQNAAAKRSDIAKQTIEKYRVKACIEPVVAVFSKLSS